MRSGQIAFIQDKTFQSDILREKMDKKGFRLWYRSFFATTIPSHCSFCPSCWNGQSGKAEANLSVWPLLVRSRSSLSAAVEAISIFSIMTWEGIPPNGVDLVRQIYHTDPGGKIGFVTGHGKKGMDILRSGVRPFGFIENVWIRMRWFGSIFDI